VKGRGWEFLSGRKPIKYTLTSWRTGYAFPTRRRSGVFKAEGVIYRPVFDVKRGGKGRKRRIPLEIVTGQSVTWKLLEKRKGA